MSGFFGIFNPKGTGIDLEAFEQMKKAADHPGHDGIETYIDDNIAFGHVMLRVSPESQYDQQPLKSSCGNYILVGHFRLDYRDELGDKLGLTQMELENTPDSLLVLMAYQKWNEKCVAHLDGDWAFVIFSKIENKINFFKDPFGISAIFYKIEKAEVVFAADILIFQNLKKHKIDLINLFCLSINGFNSIPTRTLFEGICFVQSGSFHTFKDTTKITTYFNFNSFCRERIKIFYLHDDDFVFDYFSSFCSAVRTRIYSNTQGIMLSGGLDSSAVATILDKEVKLSNRTIKAFTSTPNNLDSRVPNANKTFEEKEYVNEFCELNRSIVPNFFSFSDIHYSIYFSKCKNAFNPILTNNTFWLNSIFEVAHKEKIKLMYNGQLGNYSLSWSPYNFLLDTLIDFKFKRFFFLFKDLVYYGYSIKDILINLLLKPLRDFCVKTINLFFIKKKIFGGTVFNDKIVNEIEIKKFIKNNKIILGYSNSVDSVKIRTEVLNSLNQKIGMMWYLESFRWGITSLDPTADLRFIGKAFSFAPDLYYRNRESKYLFKKSFRAFLPSNHLKNNHVFKQSIDAALRIKNDLVLKKFIYDLKDDISLYEIFDISGVIKLYESVIDPKTNKFLLRQTNTLLKNLSVIFFFKNYS
jgi:asparagine synthase (glutamine-hydrolysing)